MSTESVGAKEAKDKPSSTDPEIKTTWQAFSPEETSQFTIAFPIFCTEWLQKGKVLIAGGGGRKGTGTDSGVVIFDVFDIDPKAHAMDNLVPLGRFNSLDALVYAMAVHPSELSVAVAMNGRTYVYELPEDGDKMEQRGSVQTDFTPVKGSNGPFQSTVAIAPTGNLLAAGGDDKRIRLYHYPTLQYICSFPEEGSGVVLKDSVHCLSFNRDGSQLAATYQTSQIYVWKVPQAHNTPKSPSFSSSSSLSSVQAQAPQVIPLSANNDMKSGGVEFCTLPGPDPSTPGQEVLFGVINGRRGPGCVAKWNTQDWKQIGKVQLFRDGLCTKMKASRDGSLVAVGSNEADLVVVNALTMQSLFKKPACHGLPPTGLSWSPDSSHVLSASADKTVMMFPVAQQQGCIKNCLKLLANVLLVLLVVILVLSTRGDKLSFAWLPDTLHSLINHTLHSPSSSDPRGDEL